MQLPSNPACAAMAKAFHNPSATADEKKTAYDGFKAAVGDNWQALIDGMKKLAEAAVANQPALNGAEQFQKFVSSFEDGSIVNVTPEQVKEEMQKLKASADKDDKAAWREFMKAHKDDFEALKKLLPEGCAPEHTWGGRGASPAPQ